jgi:hypothetical protein
MFQEALARCERGETGGIVVARLDRFARSAVDALTSIRRLTEADARLVSVEDDFDDSTPMGRFAIGILILIAELELERIRATGRQLLRRRSDAAFTFRHGRRPVTSATTTVACCATSLRPRSSRSASAGARPAPPGPSSRSSWRRTGSTAER